MQLKWNVSKTLPIATFFMQIIFWFLRSENVLEMG